MWNQRCVRPNVRVGAQLIFGTRREWMATRYAFKMVMRCVLCFGYIVLLSHVLAANDAAYSSTNNLTTCVIHAMLYKMPPEQRSVQDFGLPVDIDCQGSKSPEEGTFDLGAQRVAGKSHVLLEGSQTPPLGVSSYGLEYLDNCLELETLEIEGFKGDASLKLDCGGQASMEHLKEVTLRNNELGTLRGQSFEKLPNLKRIFLINNSLKIVETLAEVKQLEKLVIQDENDLILKENQFIQQLEQLLILEMKHLKGVKAQLLENLPGNLTELRLEKTPVQPRNLILRNGTAHLTQLTLVDCNLTSLVLDPEGIPALTQLNLSGNALLNLHLNLTKENSITMIDLSRNHLKHLNLSWFLHLNQLQELHLQENHFQKLSLWHLLHISPLTLHYIDLRSNDLMNLQQGEKVYWDPSIQLRLLIDDNPWSCQWLLNFSHNQPQLFRLFQYAKFISQINVNGLSCQPQEPVKERPPLPVIPPDKNFSVPHPNTPNISSFTVLYGNPLEQHRNQRSEALIIVFMLPLGIALLFLLLYLYLHCERLFHLSYYISGLSCFGDDKESSGSRFVDHVDIVRFPLANGNGNALDSQPDGYETPVSGAASICNCSGHRQSTCSRMHHVTYETLPTELPYQLYAEIKEQVDDDKDGKGTAAEGSTAPIYDHLSFVADLKEET